MSKNKLALISMVIGLSGFGLFVYHAGWGAGIGLFLALYGNNLMLGLDSYDPPTGEQS